MSRSGAAQNLVALVCGLASGWAVRQYMAHDQFRESERLRHRVQELEGDLRKASDQYAELQARGEWWDAICAQAAKSMCRVNDSYYRDAQKVLNACKSDVLDCLDLRDAAGSVIAQFLADKIREGRAGVASRTAWITIPSCRTAVDDFVKRHVHPLVNNAECVADALVFEKLFSGEVHPE